MAAGSTLKELSSCDCQQGVASISHGIYTMLNLKGFEWLSFNGIHGVEIIAPVGITLQILWAQANKKHGHRTRDWINNYLQQPHPKP